MRLCIRTSALLVVLLLALHEAGAAEPAPYRIGVLVWSESIPGQVAMRKGLEDTARALDTQAERAGSRGLQLDLVVAGDGAAGIERQIRQMEAMVQARPDLLIVQPTDNAALATPLRAANAAGIPVVAYDQYISGGQLTAYVTSDNYRAGHDGGEYIAHRFDDDHTLRLVLVEYPHVSSTVERLDGFLDALKERGQPFEILGTYIAVEPVAGAAAGAAILEQHPTPGSVDVVFTVNDGGGLAVVDALAAAGRREILVATTDGAPESVDNIRAGRLTVVDSAQFCWHLGAEAMQLGWRVLQGESVPRHTLVPTFPVTPETLDLYQGWYGAPPARFKKPWQSADPEWRWRLRLPPGQAP